MTNGTTKVPPTPQMMSFFNDPQAMQVFENLGVRWMDEKQFEDIREYQKALEPFAAKHGVEIVGMTSRPFGCRCKVADRAFWLTFKVKGNRAAISYSRTK